MTWGEQTQLPLATGGDFRIPTNQNLTALASIDDALDSYTKSQSVKMLMANFGRFGH
jgi:hypothetical protein